MELRRRREVHSLANRDSREEVPKSERRLALRSSRTHRVFIRELQRLPFHLRFTTRSDTSTNVPDKLHAVSFGGGGGREESRCRKNERKEEVLAS